VQSILVYWRALISTVCYLIRSVFHDPLWTLGRYAAHIRRQDADIRLFLADESLLLQPTLDYTQVTGLSSEERERLARVRPASIVGSDLIYTFYPNETRGRAPQNEWKE